MLSQFKAKFQDLYAPYFKIPQNFFVFSFPVLTAVLSALKVIDLDGIHLRGNFKGVLLTVTMMDGYHGIVLLAYAILQGETRDTWIWFCSLLKEAIRRVSMQILAFVSDRDKGLLDSASEVFLTAAQYSASYIFSQTSVVVLELRSMNLQFIVWLPVGVKKTSSH